MKILVAIDGSPASLRALGYVLDHAGDFSTPSDLTLITVHLPIPTGRARAFLGSDAIESYYRDESTLALKEARALLAERNVHAAEILAVGDPGMEIARASKAGFQLIVLGTHGHTALRSLLMGSVATRTLAESSVPVLLVK